MILNAFVDIYLSIYLTTPTLLWKKFSTTILVRGAQTLQQGPKVRAEGPGENQ